MPDRIRQNNSLGDLAAQSMRGEGLTQEQVWAALREGDLLAPHEANEAILKAFGDDAETCEF